VIDLESRKAENEDTAPRNHWRSIRLGEISEVISKGTTPTTLGFSFTKTGVPFLRAEDIAGGAVRADSVAFHIALETDAVLARSRIKPGDLLITIAGTLGRVGYVAENSPQMNCNQAVAFARLKRELADPEFLCFSCQDERIIGPLLELKAGGSIQNLNLAQISSLKIPLPPLPEQKRIAAILNEQMAAVEKARAATEAQLKAAKALPSAYLREVFNSPEAQKWPRKPFRDVCEIIAPQIDPKIPEYGALPHVNGENIESGTCRLLYLNTAAQDGMTSGKYLFEPGDVLYSKLRPYLRKVTVVDFKGVCSADMYPISVKRDELDPVFAAWLLLSDEFTQYADGESRRARMPKLNRDQLFAWWAPMPTLGEQKRIAAIISESMATALRTRKALEEQFETIEELRATLLRRVFDGELHSD
jgi:type I restriction enzyme S subunit